MIHLLDTHLLLWAAYEPDRLPVTAREILADRVTVPMYSAASIWEVSIKASLGRNDFDVDPHILRRGLVENEYEELPITAAHAAAVRDLPPIHRDPFDRILVAQARVEGFPLLTSDDRVADYGSPTRRV